MSPTYKCRLSGDTDNIPQPSLCNCDMACESHEHLSSEETYILCWHDGETDHNHCPNALTAFGLKFDLNNLVPVWEKKK